MKKLILLSILTFLIFQTSFPQEYGWTDISENIPSFPYDTISSLTDVFFINDDEGWITTNHTYDDTAAILHTSDGGETFEVQTTLYSCNAIHMLNENEGYSGGRSGFIYKTIDGGDNWNFYGTMVATLADISFPPAGNKGYCCGLNGNIHSIDSSGVTKMTSNINGNLGSISFPINSEEGWVCGGDVIRHYKSSVWNGDQEYPSGGYNAIYMVNSLDGWTVGDGGIVAHTEDGYNWFEQTNPDPQTRTFFDVFFVNANEGWAVGIGGIILHTTNGGTTWVMENTELTTESLAGVHFTSPINGYIVGTRKTILKYTELSGTGSTIVETLKFDIFPNPAKDKVEFRSSEFATKNCSIEICDLNGRTRLEKQIPAEKENIELDVSNLQSGVYFCTMKTDKKSSTKKMIIE